MSDSKPFTLEDFERGMQAMYEGMKEPREPRPFVRFVSGTRYGQLERALKRALDAHDHEAVRQIQCNSIPEKYRDP